MKATLKINEKEIQVISIQKMASGYGHNRLTCHFIVDGAHNEHSIITSNTRLTDRMQDDDSAIEEAAQLEAAEMVVYDFLN